nr:retrovirus-related Pol polyprotein from transposon TNT 1-94 [Tanacetum cinerariifolium]
MDSLSPQKLVSQLEIHGVSLSQEDVNLKFLRSLPSEWKTHTIIWRNKADLEEQSLDDLFNSLKIYEAEVKHSFSTARLDSIRILLAIPCANDFKLYQMDIKSAFLNGFINEEVYVAQPPGFIDFRIPNYVYKLKKALYGLKQALKACTSGVCTFIGCCLTSWFAKKQMALAISTNEAEYVFAGKACQQALWMKQALIDYGIRLDDVLIMCNNKGVIDLSKNPVQHSRTKHIEIRHHFLRDNVQKGNISIEKVASEDIVASAKQLQNDGGGGLNNLANNQTNSPQHLATLPLFNG